MTPAFNIPSKIEILACPGQNHPPVRVQGPNPTSTNPPFSIYSIPQKKSKISGNANMFQTLKKIATPTPFLYRPPGGGKRLLYPTLYMPDHSSSIMYIVHRLVFTHRFFYTVPRPIPAQRKKLILPPRRILTPITWENRGQAPCVSPASEKKPKIQPAPTYPMAK